MSFRIHFVGLLSACLAVSNIADEMDFPEFEGASIEGAPTLEAPFLVTGGKSPVLTEKHGLAAPALFDWNGDGKKDLLIGDFETNYGEPPMGEDGSAVRVYLNIGTEENPQFSSEFEWARDTEGTVLEVPQWCCIGFTPYFYDLNDDGYVDMITGQYHPGEVTWFRGSKEGFLPGINLEQEGDPSSNWSSLSGDPADAPRDEIETFDYWVYSSASMGDFDDDGDYDLIFGGWGGLRISENIGTAKEPKFGRREVLLDVNGEPLKIRELTEVEQMIVDQGGIFPSDGDGKTSPYVVDWNNDGVLDLLVTNSYIKPGSHAVSFFEGVKTEEGLRFEKPVDLLPSTDGSKVLPGSGPRVYVDDWNNDGINDLIIGASVATVRDGEFSDELSWEWESVNDVEAAGKDPGRYPPQQKPTVESMKELMGEYWTGSDEDMEMLQFNIQHWDDSIGRLYKEGKEHWLTMRHQGRVYVMLGSDPSVTPDSAQVPGESDEDLSIAEADVDLEEARANTKPVQLKLNLPTEIGIGEQGKVSVTFEISKGWFIYAPTGKNAEQGSIETKVSFSIPEEFEGVGKVQRPLHLPKGSYDVYYGPEINVFQWFSTDGTEPGTYDFEATITFQTCMDDLCLPPKTETLTASLNVTEKSISKN